MTDRPKVALLLFSLILVARIYFTTGQSLTEAKTDYAKCPKNETIQPCECTEKWGLTDITCDGPNVTETTLKTLFDSLRQVNSLKPGQMITLNSVFVLDTLLNKFDLTPFFHTKVKHLFISFNRNLTQIVGPSGNNGDGSEVNVNDLGLRSIQVEALRLGRNLLTDEGLGDFLKYFSTTLINLSLANNRIRGSAHNGGKVNLDLEFLSGLSAFTKLRYLHLGWNPIERLAGGQFRHNSQLHYLSLIYCNLSSETSFDQDAFRIDEESNKGANFRWNGMTNGVVQNLLQGLTKVQKSRYEAIDVYLSENKLTTLSEPDFKPFLQAHPGNSVDVEGNPLVCDEKMDWLKNKNNKNPGSYLLSSKVKAARCSSSDGGNTTAFEF